MTGATGAPGHPQGVVGTRPAENRPRAPSGESSGYMGHVAIDPHSEIVTGTTVTAGNSGDVEPASDLLATTVPPTPTRDTDTDTEVMESPEFAAVLARTAGLAPPVPTPGSASSTCG